MRHLKGLRVLSARPHLPSPLRKPSDFHFQKLPGISTPPPAQGSMPRLTDAPVGPEAPCAPCSGLLLGCWPPPPGGSLVHNL